MSSSSEISLWLLSSHQGRKFMYFSFQKRWKANLPGGGFMQTMSPPAMLFCIFELSQILQTTRHVAAIQFFFEQHVCKLSEKFCWYLFISLSTSNLCFATWWQNSGNNIRCCINTRCWAENARNVCRRPVFQKWKDFWSRIFHHFYQICKLHPQIPLPTWKNVEMPSGSTSWSAAE